MTELFCALDSQRIVELVQSAKRFVCYAGPGIRTAPANAMVEVAGRIGSEMITVALDFDEAVLRMGFGDLEAVRRLRDAGILINNAPSLRSAFVLVDDEGYVFTPSALYLEAERRGAHAVNAMRLSSEQLHEALARLSPAAKAIAVAQAQSEVERERIASLPVDVVSKPVGKEQIDRVETSLKNAPPVKFDLTRQVRVYTAYLQYVELKLTGAAIQRHRVAVPSKISSFGSGKDLERRLRTTFDLIDKAGPLSSKALEDDLRQIRDDFTRSLGKDRGRVVLKAQKENLERRLNAFRKKLQAYQAKVAKELQYRLDQSRRMIVAYYINRVMENPPDSMLGQLSHAKPTKEDARAWLDAELNRAFPKSDALISKMQLEVRYMDATFETLNQPDFLASVKRAFPQVDWDKAHEEFRAAGEAAP